MSIAGAEARRGWLALEPFLEGLTPTTCEHESELAEPDRDSLPVLKVSLGDLLPELISEPGVEDRRELNLHGVPALSCLVRFIASSWTTDLLTKTLM
jgi:hypothetical protein